MSYTRFTTKWRTVDSNRRGSRSSLPIAVALVVVVAVGSTASAGSHTETIPEGDYTGGIYLRVDDSFLDLDGLGRLDGRFDAAGEATINVGEFESVSGIWTLEGSSVVGGTVSAGGVTGTLSANSVIAGSGPH